MTARAVSAKPKRTQCSRIISSVGAYRVWPKCRKAWRASAHRSREGSAANRWSSSVSSVWGLGPDP